MGNRRSVVVAGVDGSVSSRAALLYACEEARARGGTVEMVTVWPRGRGSSPGRDSVAYRAGHRWAVQAQSAAVAGLRRVGPDMPPLTGVVVEGSPAEVLARAGEGTAGIVLGRRPEDRTAAACSSTRERCMALATCPVVVVPAEPSGAGGTDEAAGHRLVRASLRDRCVPA
jgi:nucleotide-binding universal stress UspA family protein